MKLLGVIFSKKPKDGAEIFHLNFGILFKRFNNNCWILHEYKRINTRI